MQSRIYIGSGDGARADTVLIAQLMGRRPAQTPAGNAETPDVLYAIPNRCMRAQVASLRGELQASAAVVLKRDGIPINPLTVPRLRRSVVPPMDYRPDPPPPRQAYNAAASMIALICFAKYLTARQTGICQVKRRTTGEFVQ